MVDNTSGIIPAGFTILIKPDEVFYSDIIAIPEAEVEKAYLRQTEGTVVAIGGCAFVDEVVPRCAVGDRVVFPMWSGLMRRMKDGTQFRLVNDKDIKAVITENNHE